MSVKTPSILTAGSGLLSISRCSRDYCNTCKEETFKISGVCCHCNRGGIPGKKLKMHFNGKQRGEV